MPPVSARSLWRHLTHGLRVLVHREAADRELADEVAFYIDQAAAAHEARGLSREAARRAALLEAGRPTAIREHVRSAGWEHAVDTLLGDLRYAARRLRRSPGFTAVAVATLALGIGAATAIVGAVRPILFEPLPYPQASRLVTLWDRGADGTPLAVTFGTLREIATRGHAFEALAAVRAWQPTATGPVEPERLNGQRVTASYFRTLGVAPTLGRDFAADDDRPGAPRVVILSDGLWRRRFAADPGIVGRTITLDGAPRTVVGVLPRGFENVLAPSAEIWSPLQYAASPPGDGPEWGHNLRVVGRLRAGVTVAAAARELDAIARTPVPEFARPPWAAMRRALLVRTLQDDLTRSVRPTLLAVLGAAGVLLSLACVNVAMLLLARGAQRHGELAMRAALGAERPRLVRQLLTESLLLAAVGGVLGVAVAALGVRTLVALSPAGLPRVGAIGIDGPTLAIAAVVTTLVGLAVGLLPAFQLSRADLRRGLHHGTVRGIASGTAVRRVLIVVEAALAVVLLTGAGLLLHSVVRLLRVDPGFDPARLLTMQVQTSGVRYTTDESTWRFFAQALEAVRRVPGVEAAALGSQLPLSGDGELYGVRFEESPTGRNESAVFRYAVSPGWFETMGIPLRRGRLLDNGDRREAPLAVVINESFARRKFPGRSAIGQRLQIGPDSAVWRTVVGVVGDVKQLSLDAGDADAVYLPMEQSWFADAVMSLAVRARGADAAALAPDVARAVWSVDKDQPVVRVAVMEQLVAASAAERRFALRVFAAFALVALVLAATGIYGVLSGSVAERMRELGVRAALGASPGELLRLVVGQGMALTAAGMVLGLAGAAASSRALATLLFGVSRADPATYAGVVLLLGLVSVIACAIPGRRAAAVDPVGAMRE